MAIFLFRVVVVVVFLCGDPPSHIGPMARYRERAIFYDCIWCRLELVLWCLVVSWIPSFDVSVWVTTKGKKEDETYQKDGQWWDIGRGVLNFWSTFEAQVLYYIPFPLKPSQLSLVTMTHTSPPPLTRTPPPLDVRLPSRENEIKTLLFPSERVGWKSNQREKVRRRRRDECWCHPADMKGGRREPDKNLRLSTK